MSYILPVKIDKGTGTPLVLLHGLGNNYQSWSYVLENLDYSKQRVIVFDLLGFGDAPKPDLEYTPKDHADAVVATLNKLGVEKVILTGHSMGCIVAIEIAHYYAERVEKMVLFGAPLYRVKPRNTLWRRMTRAEGVYFKLFELVRKNPEAVQAGGKIADEIIPFVKGMEITEATWRGYKKSLENTIMQYQSYKKVTEMKVPILFVNGLLDFFIIRKNVYSVHRANRGYVRIKNVLGPHELTPRQGKTAARIIQRFL
jgi:pimeloyl-ACP methyl ester carboxylesterase